MEVLEANEAPMTNSEVMQFLKEQRAEFSSKTSKKIGGSVATIMLETLRMLESSPCKDQVDQEKVKNFLSEIEDFQLTQTEKIMLINLCPTSQVEVVLIVENAEERLSDEQTEKLLNLVQKYLVGEKNVNSA